MIQEPRERKEGRIAFPVVQKKKVRSLSNDDRIAKTFIGAEKSNMGCSTDVRKHRKQNHTYSQDQETYRTVITIFLSRKWQKRIQRIEQRCQRLMALTMQLGTVSHATFGECVLSTDAKDVRRDRTTM